MSHITHCGETSIYNDGMVIATLIIETDGVIITEFESLDEGAGNTLKALRRLKREFGHVTAQNIGDAGDASFEYWMHIHAKGLVDRLIDASDDDVTPALQVAA